MFRWLYRLLFARRAVWVYERPDGQGDYSRARLTVYDPEPGDIVEGYARLGHLEEDGWTLVSGPERPDEGEE